MRSKYQSVIGSLLYIMLGTRPDIAFAVIKMSQFCANPTAEHLQKALYIVRYLKGTKDLSITYDGYSKSSFTAFSDTDWAGNLESRRSTTGFIVFLADGPISWVSKRQKTIALSSTEAEYMALTETCRQITWQRSLLQEMSYQLPPFPLYGDNQGSLFLASNPAQEHRTKHVDVHHHYVCECVEREKVQLFFVPTQEQLADIFTKNLTWQWFEDVRKNIHLHPYSQSSQRGGVSK
jgi:hypothetical protein